MMGKPVTKQRVALFTSTFGLRGHRVAMFVGVWTLAILATVLAFVLHLALRGKTVALGYELGRARAEQARLREVKRVLEVESASYKTPERVEIVARTLLGMEPPPADRMIVLPAGDDRRASNDGKNPR
jgi:cell division protein FtsL